MSNNDVILRLTGNPPLCISPRPLFYRVGVVHGRRELKVSHAGESTLAESCCILGHLGTGTRPRFVHVEALSSQAIFLGKVGLVEPPFHFLCKL
ncbi:hypothetical protein CEXT_701621 [Caerostris extrusa]|uniref:Uncharacterized protein n=1 Tax=Caerostris extrusa TaxID=172846 RepID=A0AAV4WZZ1_CAEEX|nr:hypothetical protein CEXT_701621 [Caerostris extrusa]